MNEGDSGTPTTHPRLGVDELGTVGGEMFESGLDVGHRERYVVHTFTVLRQELAHRGFRPQGLEKLDERPAHRDHRLLDPLLGNGLPVQRLDPITVSVTLDSSVEVGNGDRDMVEIQQFHVIEGICPTGSWHHIAGSISDQEVL